MTTTQQDIESRLSYAYLHAVVARAGFVCRPATIDEDKEGIDAVVTAYRAFPNTYRTQVTVNIQLKATVKAPADSGSHFSYSIAGISRYDKLREDHREPSRLLVVLFLPEDQLEWLRCTDEQLVLKRCAYWVSLRMAPPSDNTTAQTVKIPKSQILDPAGIESLANRLACADIPRYEVP